MSNVLISKSKNLVNAMKIRKKGTSARRVIVDDDEGSYQSANFDDEVLIYMSM
jgi:hypothetical protein